VSDEKLWDESPTSRHIMSLYKEKAVYAASERNTLSRWRNSSA